MKANVPERIWIDPTNDLPKLSGHIDKDSAEYTRTDAFIDKAVKWLEDNAINYWGTDAVDNGKMMLDFKKAMRA